MTKFTDLQVQIHYYSTIAIEITKVLCNKFRTENLLFIGLTLELKSDGHSVKKCRISLLLICTCFRRPSIVIKRFDLSFACRPSLSDITELNEEDRERFIHL